MLGWLLLLVACVDAPTELPPCETVGDPDLEVAPSDLDFGAFTDGDPLYYGTPPQGGAPYSPFHARATGLAGLDDGAVVDLSAVDRDDGAALGAITYDVRFVCANVGASAGTWVGSDLHLRFEGWALEDLAGRRAELTVEVSDLAGTSVAATLDGVLTQM